MNMMSHALLALVAIFLVAGVPGCYVHASRRAANPTRPFQLPALPYGLADLQPIISEQTMRVHYTGHNNTVRALSTVLPSSGGADTLPSLLQLVGSGTLLPNQELALRRTGGSHFNHAFFWKVMAPPGSAATNISAISPALMAAINKSFGSLDAMKANFTASANGIFGSGWAWLAMTPMRGRGPRSLVIIATPNQDNPLMKVVSKRPMIPIMGLDVWEHAYFLQYLSARASYTAAWWSVVNWEQVSRNYESALNGDAGATGTAF